MDLFKKKEKYKLREEKHNLKEEKNKDKKQRKLVKYYKNKFKNSFIRGSNYMSVFISGKYAEVLFKKLQEKYSDKINIKMEGNMGKYGLYFEEKENE
jgi:hypothetical protein